MIELKTRTKQLTAPIEPGFTILDIALKHDLDWGFSCTRGTCARCRCFVAEGLEHLHLPSDEELDRLEPDELERGYRLGCQAKLRQDGHVSVIHKPYF